MSATAVEQIVRTLLYEGYILYPYRASAVKNRWRWTFGGLVPHAYSDAQEGGEPWLAQTQCLVQADPGATLNIRVRFLHLVERVVGELSRPLEAWGPESEPTFRPVEALRVGDELVPSWQEAVEREAPSPDLNLEELAASPRRFDFAFPGRRSIEPLCGPDGLAVGVLERRQHTVEGAVEPSAERVAERLFRVTVRALNCSPLERAESVGREAAMLRSLVSTHTILGVRGGAFVSLLDPPDALRPLAEGCRNVGTWPVLVGEEGSRDTMLSSPIILYDYPRVAPESPGEFFDGVEIDELLALRILTLSEEEKRQMSGVDARARALLDRTEALADSRLSQLHGAIRHFRPVVQPGDRVRLRPRGRADALDLLLAGKAATVAAVEQDVDGRTYFAVTVDEDPGQEFGHSGMPGHRFFFRPEEVELLPADGGNGP